MANTAAALFGRDLRARVLTSTPRPFFLQRIFVLGYGSVIALPSNGRQTRQLSFLITKVADAGDEARAKDIARV